jgi:hypothetical protein
MLGIGKKKETKKSVFKDAMRGSPDEIQFNFEEDDKLPFDDEGFADEYEEETPSGGQRQGLSQRKGLLALLLLLALGGGGYYYLNSTPTPPPRAAAPVKSKVVMQPATPAPAVKPVSSSPVVAPPAQDSQSAPVVKDPVAPVAKTVTAAKPPVSTAAVAVPAEIKASATTPPVTQPYTLSAGAYLGQEYQRETEKKIRRLGYTPKVQKTYRMVPMTRLLLGLYDDPAAAQARSRELARLVPDLFSLKQGDRVALYAGSYQSLDQARSFADKLYRHGILVDEETVSLRMPLHKISFGSFSTRAAAEKAAKRAAAAGLPAQVVKR